jgi:malate synthase
MIRVPSVPGVQVGASWLGGCEHVLTAGALEITGPADRKMIINALNCGAKIVMADFEGSNTATFGNLVTGQLNLRNASRRRYRRCLPDSAASKMPRERSATSSPPGSGRPRSR